MCREVAAVPPEVVGVCCMRGGGSGGGGGAATCSGPCAGRWRVKIPHRPGTCVRRVRTQRRVGVGMRVGMRRVSVGLSEAVAVAAATAAVGERVMHRRGGRKFEVESRREVRRRARLSLHVYVRPGAVRARAVLSVAVAGQRPVGLAVHMQGICVSIGAGVVVGAVGGAGEGYGDGDGVDCHFHRHVLLAVRPWLCRSWVVERRELFAESQSKVEIKVQAGICITYVHIHAPSQAPTCTPGTHPPPAISQITK